MEQHLSGPEKRPSARDSISEEDLSGSKRLKQGRLPFKPLDCKPSTPSNKTPSRKRKLSEQDSPSNKAKNPKLPDLKNAGEKGKPASVKDDNEVSSTSSSETEHLTVSSNKSKTGKANLLEKFVRREDEISSTNDVIDLTDSLDESGPNENSPVKTRSPKKPVLKSPLKSPRAKPEAVLKDKLEYNFSRKLVFDKEESAKSETEDVLGDSASPNKGEETTQEKTSMECGASEDDKEGGDTNEDGKESLQESEADTPSKDESPNSSESESSDSQPSTPEKEEGGDSPSDDKTPASRDCPSLTDTPQTPASSNTSRSSTDGVTPLNSSKKPRVLSKKQLDKLAMWQKVKEEKEKQKQEEKEKREKERLEKKQKRDEEKAERERAKKEEKGKKEKERLEKKEQAEKEKQAKIQQKEEEKQKKQDKIIAEKKMKEDEKRQKEEEEQEKLREAQKRKEAFTSFFIKPKAVTSTKVTKAEDSLFIPFELKKDMTLAPVIRHKLSEADKECLRRILSREESGKTMYLDELKQNLRRPTRTNRMLREKKEIDQEVELLVHDSETVKKVTHAVKLLQFHTDYRPSYFGTWRKKVNGLSPRNPWKKDEGIFDYEVDSDEEWEEEEPGESLSDSNGEEEEGEEEDDGDDDGWMVPHGYLSEDEGCQDDEDVTPEMLKARQRAKAQAWETELLAKKRMLPPLHLGCFWLDRPCVRDEHLSIFRDFEMVCLRSSPIETLVSCPTMYDTVGEKSADSSSPTYKGCRKRALPEKAMPDLIRLVHGNYAGIKKLVREFRLFWKQKCSDANLSVDESHMEEEESKVLNDSVMDSSANLEESVLETVEPAADATKTTEHEPMQIESSDKTAEDEASGKRQDDSIVTEEPTTTDCVSKRQLEIKIMSIAVREKRPGKKQCWYVNDSTLKQYKMEDLSLENSWVYVSGDLGKKTENKTPRSVTENKTPTHSAEIKVNKSKDLGKPADAVSNTDNSITPHKGKDVACLDTTPKSSKSKKEASSRKTPKDQPSIMAFAKKASAGSRGDKTKTIGSKTSTDHSAKKKGAKVNKSTGGNTTEVADQSTGGNTTEVADQSTGGNTTEVADQVSREQPASSQQSAEPMDEDCIILD